MTRSRRTFFAVLGLLAVGGLLVWIGPPVILLSFVWLFLFVAGVVNDQTTGSPLGNFLFDNFIQMTFFVGLCVIAVHWVRKAPGTK